MSDFAGKVVVITGAGSGIGRALALNLAGQGAKLAISDVDTIGLAETTRLVEAIGAEVKSDHLDVTQREAVLEYADAVVAHFGKVNQIYNNAGIAYHGTFEKSEFKDFERVMDVDFWGVVNGTKAFLPHVIASGDGHIVNVSSLFGLLSMPGQSAYNSAKFAVRGFTESLRQEMLIAKHPVKVTCVHPAESRPPSHATPPQARVKILRSSPSSSTASSRAPHRRTPPRRSSTVFGRASREFSSGWTQSHSTPGFAS